MQMHVFRWLLIPAALGFGATAAPGAVEFTAVHSFNGTDGAGPEATLIQARDSWLYGTTISGGTNGLDSGGFGTVFRVSTNGAFTSLLSFSGPDAASPQSGVLQAGDGNLYGVTDFGGSASSGAFYRLTPGGEFTALCSFTSATGVYPHGLTAGPDDVFYGTAYSGGADPGLHGTVFKLTSQGSVSTVASFHGTNGSHPQAKLFLAADGNYYGTTVEGGSYGLGTLFRVTPGGNLETLFSFDGTNGARPVSALLQGADGAIYGTAYDGGIGFNGTAYSGNGTVFRLATNGTLITLYRFGGPPQDASRPGFGGLIEARDGYFYGTSEAGGTEGSGTIFRMAPDGTLNVLYSFTRPDYATGTNVDGWSPTAGLLQTGDDTFYGVAMCGGAHNRGVVFRVSISPEAPVLRCVSAGLGQVLLSWSAARGKTYEPQRATNLAAAIWEPLGVVVATNTTAQASDFSPGDCRFYRVLMRP